MLLRSMKLSMVRMVAFIDSGIFIGLHNKRDVYHATAKEIIRSVVNGNFGNTYTSDYVLDEVIAFTYRKTKNPEIVLEAINLIQNSGKIEILHVDRSVFASAKMCVEQHPSLFLSFTDWTIANLMVKSDIPTLLSFDSGFDKLKSMDKFSGIRRISKI